jgi:hypothetical protein
MRGTMLTILCSFSVGVSLQSAVFAAEQTPVPSAVTPPASAAPAAGPVSAASTTSTPPVAAHTAPSTTSTPASVTSTAPAAANPAPGAAATAAPSTTSTPATAAASSTVTTSATHRSATKSRTAVTSTAPAPQAAPADPREIEEQLHDLVDTLKKVYNAAQNLQSECNRVYNADALDNVIMDPWMEGQPGLAHVIPPPFPGALKALPARKKWVDYDQTQITQLLRMLTNEVNTIGTASSLDSSIKVTVEILQDNLQQVDEQYAHLNSLTNPSTVDAKGQPNYDKTAITKTAQALKDETSGMNEIRKRLLRQLKEVSRDK